MIVDVPVESWRFCFPPAALCRLLDSLLNILL